MSLPSTVSISAKANAAQNAAPAISPAPAQAGSEDELRFALHDACAATASAVTLAPTQDSQPEASDLSADKQAQTDAKTDDTAAVLAWFLGADLGLEVTPKGQPAQAMTAPLNYEPGKAASGLLSASSAPALTPGGGQTVAIDVSALAAKSLLNADTKHSDSTSKTALAPLLNLFANAAGVETGESAASANLINTHAPASQSVTQSASGAPTHVSLAQTPEAKWGQQLLSNLHEQVQLQLKQQVQHATIRLDPPELGKLDISLSHEAGRLTVQLHAAQPDVARLLQSVSERLRMELSGVQFSEVEVFTNADGHSGRERSRQGRSSGDDTVASNFLDEPEQSARLDPSAEGLLARV